MAKKTLRYAVKRASYNVYSPVPVYMFNTKYEALRYINNCTNNGVATVGYRVLVKYGRHSKIKYTTKFYN